MFNLAPKQIVIKRIGRHGTTEEPIDLEKYHWFKRDCPCGLPAGECKEHPRARASQLPPEGEWTRWFLMAGRGFGKTKAGAEWVRSLAEEGAAQRIALVGPTAAGVRDVMVEGVSGILAVSRPDFRPEYSPSLSRLTWPNGVIASCFSADEPERLRGPQHEGTRGSTSPARGATGRKHMTCSCLVFVLANILACV